MNQITWWVRHSCKGHRADIWRRPGAKHCSSLCSQSEGGEYCGGQARAKNPTKICPRALAIFATCSWPSLCKQSELQCWRRNRRLCGPVQISAARALPLTFDISILNTLPYRGEVHKSAPRGRGKPLPLGASCRGAASSVFIGVSVPVRAQYLPACSPFVRARRDSGT